MLKHVAKLFLIALLFAYSALAVDTTISDTIYNADGTKPSGTITVVSSTMNSAGRYIAHNTFVERISQGVVNFTLAPNDTASPVNTKYVATYGLTSGLTYTENWVVPTSASPVKLNAVRVVGAPPSPIYSLNLNQILSGGATQGQVPVWNGTIWSPGTAPGFTAPLVSSTAAFSSPSTTWTIANTLPYVAVACLDNTGLYIECGYPPQIDPTTKAITVRWNSAQAGSVRLYSGSTYTKTISSVTSVTVLPETHQLTSVRFIGCLDASGNIVSFGQVTSTPSMVDTGGGVLTSSLITAQFATPQTGTFFLIGEI